MEVNHKILSNTHQPINGPVCIQLHSLCYLVVEKITFIQLKNVLRNCKPPKVICYTEVSELENDTHTYTSNYISLQLSNYRIGLGLTS